MYVYIVFNCNMTGMSSYDSNLVMMTDLKNMLLTPRKCNVIVEDEHN